MIIFLRSRRLAGVSCGFVERGQRAGRMVIDMTRSRSAALVLLVTVAIGGCGNKAAAKAGDPAVHQRIAALTDCKAIQAEFDTASANHDRASTQVAREASTAYMATADDRMREIGCYKK
jgi:hypothetical protein